MKKAIINLLYYIILMGVGIWLASNFDIHYNRPLNRAVGVCYCVIFLPLLVVGTIKYKGRELSDVPNFVYWILLLSLVILVFLPSFCDTALFDYLGKLQDMEIYVPFVFWYIFVLTILGVFWLRHTQKHYPTEHAFLKMNQSITQTDKNMMKAEKMKETRKILFVILL